MSWSDQLDVAAAALPTHAPPPSLVDAVLAAVADAALDAAASSLPVQSAPPALQTAVLDAVLLEQAAQDLPVHDAPEPVQRAVLTAMTMPVQSHGTVPERAPANRRWTWSAIVLAAVALLALGRMWPQEKPVDIERMTARGSDELHAEVDLSMAVQRGDGSLERFDRTAPYAPGDTLLFRYRTNASAEVVLVRVDARGAEVLHRARVEAGRGDLLTEGMPLGYELEEGEDDGVFALVSIEASDRGWLDALPAGGDAGEVCEAVRAAGGWCSAERVEVRR